MISQAELDEFRRDCAAWMAENRPAEPDFLLPLTFMEVGSDPQFDFLRNWQHKVWEAGYLGAAWPKDYGGGGLDQAFQDIATDEMRKARVPIMLNAIGLNWTGPLLLDIGTPDQKAKYVKNILSAEDIWCQGFSEPENGSDLGNAQLKAVRDGDDYVLTGSKIWTTQGSYAKYMILLARTDPKAANKYAGLSFFLAPMDVAGIDTQPIRKLTGEFGFTQTFFTEARIPADCLMGAENTGWLIAMRVLEYERGARGGQAGGQALTAVEIDDLISLAKRALRDGEPALDDPQIRDELVQFITEYRALMLNKAREKILPLNQDRPMSLNLGSKLMATEFMRRMHQFAVQLQGAAGSFWVGEEAALDGGLWQRGYLNAFSATIGGGTSEIQKNILGEHVLGLPKK